MIVRLCEDTPKLGLRIVQPGCSGKQLMDRHVDLVITPASCPSPDYKEPYWEDCELKWRDMRPEIPALTYPAFEVDDDGNVVFYFDFRLWSLPPGRYRGQVMLGGSCAQTCFDIDLCNRPVIIDRAVAVDTPPCGEFEC